MPLKIASTPSLIPYFMPSLGSLLLRAENTKGTPLTEAEVLAIRDGGVCIMLPADVARSTDENRGYQDLNPENVWADFLVLKRALAESPAESTEPETPASNP